MHRIAEAYQVSRQRIHVMRRRWALAPEDFRSPEKIFDVLLQNGVAGPVRSRLTDPSVRASIRLALR